MKPYFAKYLPIEGEIKEGDVCYLDPIGFGKAIMDYGELCFYSKHPTSGGSLTTPISRNLNDKRPYKLFLCSRDVKPLDIMDENIKVHIYHDNSEPPFKSLGEISTEATWVKEGDEFTEEEISRNRICHDSPGNTGCCFHCSRSKGCDSEDYNYLIKGPCGHFH